MGEHRKTAPLRSHLKPMWGEPLFPSCWQLIRHALLFLLLCIGAGGSAQAQTEPPNIVMIIGDDHGWIYSGFMGNEIVQTPTLDRLAEEGTVFTHAHSTASVCRPALRTLLSGLHPMVWDERIEEIESEGNLAIGPYWEVNFVDTLPNRLRENGYTSFEAGKYWEGTFDRAGFDAGMADTFSGGLSLDGDEFGRPSTQELWDFLDSAAETPFFLWLAPMIPHVPMDPGPEFTQLYQDQGLVNGSVLYYANITRLDALIDQMLEGLAERGLSENTLIIYVSDNGLEHDPYMDHPPWGFIFGGDRGKISMYELGFRTPLILHWPGEIPAGQRFSDLVSFEDLYSTTLDYGGVEPGDFDTGVSLRERIEGDAGPARHRIYGMMDRIRTRPEEYEADSGMAGLTYDEWGGFARTESWRFVHYVDRGERELYRIEEDPLEQINVLDEYPVIAERLENELSDWMQQGYLVPEPSKNFLMAAALMSLAWLGQRKRLSPHLDFTR